MIPSANAPPSAETSWRDITQLFKSTVSNSMIHIPDYSLRDTISVLEAGNSHLDHSVGYSSDKLPPGRSIMQHLTPNPNITSWGQWDQHISHFLGKPIQNLQNTEQQEEHPLNEDSTSTKSSHDQKNLPPVLSNTNPPIGLIETASWEKTIPGVSSSSLVSDFFCTHPVTQDAIKLLHSRFSLSLSPIDSNSKLLDLKFLDPPPSEATSEYQILAPISVLEIFDSLISCLSSWLIDSAPFTILFSSLYTLIPDKIVNPVLQSIILGYLKTIALFQDLIKSPFICRASEDFSLDNPGFSLVPLVSPIQAINGLSVSIAILNSHLNETSSSNLISQLKSRCTLLKDLVSFLASFTKFSNPKSSINFDFVQKSDKFHLLLDSQMNLESIIESMTLILKLNQDQEDQPKLLFWETAFDVSPQVPPKTKTKTSTPSKTQNQKTPLMVSKNDPFFSPPPPPHNPILANWPLTDDQKSKIKDFYPHLPIYSPKSSPLLVKTLDFSYTRRIYGAAPLHKIKIPSHFTSFNRLLDTIKQVYFGFSIIPFVSSCAFSRMTPADRLKPPLQKNVANMKQQQPGEKTIAYFESLPCPIDIYIFSQLWTAQNPSLLASALIIDLLLVSNPSGTKTKLFGVYPLLDVLISFAGRSTVLWSDMYLDHASLAGGHSKHNHLLHPENSNSPIKPNQSPAITTLASDTNKYLLFFNQIIPGFIDWIRVLFCPKILSNIRASQWIRHSGSTQLHTCHYVDLDFYTIRSQRYESAKLNSAKDDIFAASESSKGKGKGKGTHKGKSKSKSKSKSKAKGTHSTKGRNPKQTQKAQHSDIYRILNRPIEFNTDKQFSFPLIKLWSFFTNSMPLHWFLTGLDLSLFSPESFDMTLVPWYIEYLCRNLKDLLEFRQRKQSLDKDALSKMGNFLSVFYFVNFTATSHLCRTLHLTQFVLSKKAIIPSIIPPEDEHTDFQTRYKHRLSPIRYLQLPQYRSHQDFLKFTTAPLSDLERGMTLSYESATSIVKSILPTLPQTWSIMFNNLHNHGSTGSAGIEASLSNMPPLRLASVCKQSLYIPYSKYAQDIIKSTLTLQIKTTLRILLLNKKFSSTLNSIPICTDDDDDDDDGASGTQPQRSHIYYNYHQSKRFFLFSKR